MIDDAYNGLMGEEFMRKTRERLHWICAKVVGEKVLDVGCSQGTFARLLAPLGKSVLGVDINREAVAYAEGKLQDLDPSLRERLRFMVINFMDFRPEERFNTVVMGEILERLPDPAAFVKKAWSILSSGGTLVITVPFGINDNPDHRQTFYWSWAREIVAPLFDIREIKFFGRWLGVVGVKRDRKAPIEKSVPLSMVKELEKAFYAVERPLVNDNEARGHRLQEQMKDIDEAKKSLAAKIAEVKAAASAESAQKARADKAVADYVKLKSDLSAEIAKQKTAIDKLAAEKTVADASAAKQKTVFDSEVERLKTANAAEQAKVKDLNTQLVAVRSELAETKSEALELRVNLDAEKKMADGQLDQISVLKAALQFAANRQQNSEGETKLLEYSQEVKTLRNALDAKCDEAVARAERVGILTGKVEALTAEKDCLRLSLADAENRLGEISKRLSESREEAARATADKSAAEKELSAVRAELAAMKDTMAEVERRIAEQAKGLEEARDRSSALESEKSAIEETLKDLAAENERKDGTIRRIADERTAFEQSLALLKREAQARDGELVKTREELCRLRQEADKAVEELRQEKQTAAETSSVFDELREEANALRNSNNELKEDIRKFEEEIGARDRQLEVIRRSMDGEKAKGSALATELEKCRDRLNAATSRIATRETDIARVRKEVKDEKRQKKLLRKRLKAEKSKREKLAKSKLGRLTLAYWRIKDGIKVRLTKRPPTSNVSAKPPVAVVESDKPVAAKPAEVAAPAKADGVKKKEQSSDLALQLRAAQKSLSDLRQQYAELKEAKTPSAAGTTDSSKGLRVLFPCGSGNNAGANPFVGTLMESMGRMGVQVSYGADLIFKEDIPFDVVHFMWPEALFGWAHENITEASYVKLRQCISRLKAAGTCIAYTRHNIRPHTNDNPSLLKLYDLIEKSSDVIFHMGEYSLNEFMAMHPDSHARNVIVPHHTYARIPRTVTKKEAREWLGLSEDDKVVLSFGVFRTDEECELLADAVKDCGVAGLKVLAPRFPGDPPEGIITLHGKSVPEQVLPMYFAAADVVFIQRCHILNSGNLPMAFYFGCACVGPDDGDVGEILRETGNPVFKPEDKGSAAKAIYKAFAAISKYKRGIKNRNWADKYWQQDEVAEKIISGYRDEIAELQRKASVKPVFSIVIDKNFGSKEACLKTKASLKAQTCPVEVIENQTFEKGLQSAKGDFTVFLMRGDELSSDFTESSLRAFRNEDVDCVVLRWHFQGKESCQSYAEKIVSRCQEGLCIAPEALMPLSATLFGCVFRTSAIQRNAKFLESLSAISQKGYELAFHDIDESLKVYVMRTGGFYSPSGSIDTEQALRGIDEAARQILDERVAVGVKRRRMGQLQLLTDRLYVALSLQPEARQIKLCKEFLKREKGNVFFNRSLFIQKKAVAFCHNFPPSVDASSFVSAKRLREIDGLEGVGLNWTVISQDMRSIRPLDTDFQTFYSDSLSSRQIELTGKFGFAPVLQQPYADAAAKEAETLKPDVIYSRAFFIGSHMAAYQYKKAHPEVKWYAEFSDPVAYAVDNTVRACPDKGPTWFDTEKMVYELADVVIFTNEKQRAYMLDYNPDKSMNAAIMRKSIVMNQPILPHEYCKINPYVYPLDPKKINIGYFGTFYKNRTSDDMLQLLENKDVVLHIFTTKPEELYDQSQEWGERLRINHTVSHLEFLNIGSKLDYLFLNDATFVGGDNPFLPSKYADYMATGTRIIAKVQKGSTLSEIQSPNLIKVEAITSGFVNSLKQG